MLLAMKHPDISALSSEIGFCAAGVVDFPGDGRWDRRIGRTRRALRRAMAELTLAKGYDPLTVEDICAHADVARSTFYAHYQGKDALKLESLDALQRVLKGVQRPSLSMPRPDGVGTFAFVAPLFAHGQGHLALHVALKGGRGELIAAKRFRDIVKDLVRAEIDAGPHREAAIAFAAGALTAMVLDWLDGGAKTPAATMAERFQRYILMGLVGVGASIEAPIGQAQNA